MSFSLYLYIYNIHTYIIKKTRFAVKERGKKKLRRHALMSGLRWAQRLNPRKSSGGRTLVSRLRWNRMPQSGI